MDRSTRVMIIRDSITKIAKILTNNQVIVTQAGVKAFVTYDEKSMKALRVNLPMIPDDASAELIDAVQGFLDSEISKVLYADAKSSLRSKYENLEGLYNPIESLFCEKEMTKSFPGSRKNLNFMHQAFVDRFIEPKLREAIANGASEQELFQVLAVPALRAWGGQPFFQDYMSDKWSLIAGIQKELDPIASKMAKMTKASDCYEMARDIRNVVHGEPEAGDGDNPFGDESGPGRGRGKSSGSAPGKGKGGSGKNPFDDEEEDGEGGGSGDESETEETDDESEGDAGGGEEDAGEEDESEGSGATETDAEEEDADKDEGNPSDSGAAKEGEAEQEKRDDLTENNESAQQENGGRSFMKSFDWDKVQDMGTEFSTYVSDLCSTETEAESYTVFTREWDQIEPPRVPRSYTPEWMIKMEDAISGMVGPVGRQLERAFAARNKSLWQQGTTRGRLASNNLYRLSAGDDHIFKKKIVHKTRDVAVSLVVDCSGSMWGAKMFTAMCAAWVMADVLQRLGISNEVIGFTTGDLDSAHANALYEEYREERKKGRNWDRAEPIRMPIFKSFDERFGIEQKKRMCSFQHISGAMASNIDGESVQVAYERLIKHASKGKPKGRMMIVFSDGSPAAGVPGPKLNAHLKRVINKIEADGVNIVGVGIQSNTVQRFYRKNVVLDNIEELPGIVLKELRDALLSA